MKRTTHLPPTKRYRSLLSLLPVRPVSAQSSRLYGCFTRIHLGAPDPSLLCSSPTAGLVMIVSCEQALVRPPPLVRVLVALSENVQDVQTNKRFKVPMPPQKHRRNNSNFLLLVRALVGPVPGQGRPKQLKKPMPRNYQRQKLSPRSALSQIS